MSLDVVDPNRMRTEPAFRALRRQLTSRRRARRLSFETLEDRRLLTTYFVDATSGNDSSVGTTAETAWRTLAKVEGVALLAGDNVLLKRGETFAEQFDINRGGTAGSPLTFGAYGTGNDPVVLRLRVNDLGDYTVFEHITIDANKGNSDAVQIVNANNVTLRNMEVRNGVRDGIDVTNADNLLIDGLKIHHFLAGSFTQQEDAHGIAASQTQGLTIRNTEISHVSGDSFQADPNRDPSITTDILIEGSHFWTGPLDADFSASYPGWVVDWKAGERPGENAIDTKVADDASTVAVPMQMTVRDVVAHGWVQDGFINNRAVFNMKEKVAAVFDRVTVYDSEIGFRVRGEGTGTRGNADVTIQNAVVYDVLKAIRAEDALENLSVLNSTFGDGITTQIEIVEGAGGTPTWVLLNNAFLSSRPVQASHESNRLASASDFVNSAARDYNLVGSSTLRNIGVSVASVSVDRDGVNRPQGAAYDVGAYEWTQTISGRLWNDLDADGLIDAGEAPLSNWTVYLDNNLDGKLDAQEPTAPTDLNGNYSFSITSPSTGRYFVAAIRPAGYRQTNPVAASFPPDDDGDLNGLNVEKMRQITLAEFNAFGGAPASARANDIYSYVSPEGEEYALIGLERGVGFVRVTDPANSTIVAVMPGLDEGGGALVADSTATVETGDSNRIAHHDDGDGEHPTKEGSVWRDIKVFGQYAYAVTESAAGRGVQVFDLTQIDQGIVTDITPVTQVGPSTSHTVSVNPASGYLYLSGSSATNGFSNNGGLVAIDVNNPANPVANTAWKWSGHYIHDVLVVSYTEGAFAGREIAYGFGTTAGVYVIDVTDKANMFTVATVAYPNVRYAHDGTLSEDRKYLFINDELDERDTTDVETTTTYVINVADPANPFYVTSFTNGLPAIDHNLMVRGGFIFEANYRSGLRVYDISDINNIAETGHYDTFLFDNALGFNGAWGVDSRLPSRTVVISDIEGGLFVLDATRAAVPRGEYMLELDEGQAASNIHFGFQATLAVSIGSNSISEDGGSSSGTVTRGGDTSGNLVVNLTSSDTGEATVPATVTILDGQSSANFTVAAVDDAVSDGTQSVTITASSSGLASGTGTVNVTDNEPALPFAAYYDFGTASSPLESGYSRVTEINSYNPTAGYGWTTSVQSVDRGTGTSLRRDQNFAADMTFVVNVSAGTYDVTVTSGDASFSTVSTQVYLEGTLRATAPAQAAGQWYTNTFSVNVTDGQLTLRLVGSGGNAKLNGLDIVAAATTEPLTVAITAAQMSENGGTSTATVTRGGLTTGNLVVNLASSDTTEATVPATVTILDGQASANFTVTAVNDALADGTQSVTITASASGFTNGTDTIDVTDDEPAAPFNVHYDFGTASSPLESGYTRVTEASSYNATAGFGWTTTVQSVDRGTGTSLRRDQNFATDMTFVVNVSAGTYDVTVTSGDASFSTVSTQVYLEGTLRATAPAQAAGQWYTNTFSVNVTDGQLTLRLVGSGGNAKLNGLDIVAAATTEPLTVAITAAQMSENGGTSSATVTRGGSTVGNLVVNLASSDTTEATVPATVTILDGQASANFTVTAVNDALADGTQSVTITASASGFTNGTDTIDVTDDEPALPFAAYYDFGTASSPLESGYTRVTEASSYNATAGFGWTTTVQSVDRGTGTSLRRDQNYAADMTFVVNVSAGTYDVTLTSGDASFSTVSTQVYLEGTLRATAPAQAVGQYYVNTLSVNVTDGQLTLRLVGIGGNAKINSLDVVFASVQPLTVAITAAQMSENGGTSSATVTRSGSTVGNLVVNLASSDTTEATVPATVTILDGQASANFTVTAVNDALVDGTQSVTITASASGYSNGTDTINVTDDEASAFFIDVIFIDSSLTPSQQAIFQTAANKWSTILTGDIPNVFVPGSFFEDGVGRTVDDLAIEASAPSIDGVGGILGQAGPEAVRSGSFLPAKGLMQFDSADVANMEANGQLLLVILHEMGHVLGIGTIWSDLGLLSGAGGGNPRFTGTNARAEYNSIFGNSETSVPVENTGGSGTRDSHWRESTFNNELMTGFLDSGSNPLSRITAASMIDLGYPGVNVSAADFYTPPGGLLAGGGSEGSSGSGASWTGLFASEHDHGDFEFTSQHATGRAYVVLPANPGQDAERSGPNSAPLGEMSFSSIALEVPPAKDTPVETHRPATPFQPWQNSSPRLSQREPVARQLAASHVDRVFAEAVEGGWAPQSAVSRQEQRISFRSRTLFESSPSRRSPQSLDRAQIQALEVELALAAVPWDQIG